MVIYFLQQVVWGHLFGVHLLALGMLMVTLVLCLPGGILGTLGGGHSTSLGRLLGRFRQPDRNP